MILNEAFDRAHRLASAHGHWWAGVVEPRPQGWTLDQIAAAQTAAIDSGESWALIGLQFSLSHSTATGRLEWTVAADGAVTLLGCRAGRAFGLPALSVTVATATVDLGGNARVAYPRGHAALSAGVVGALKGALSALGLSDEHVLLALGPEAVALWAADQMAWAAARVKAVEAAANAAPAPAGSSSLVVSMAAAGVSHAVAALPEARAALALAARTAHWAEMRRAPPRRPYDKRPVPLV